MAEGGDFKLIIEDDQGRRSVVPIDLGEVSIGRLDGNTIRLNERNVSRRHARLFRDNGEIVAEDLDSYNGVFINGARINGRQEVCTGDLIRIGDFQLELKGEGLKGRTEETTQRTHVNDIEVTQPEIRLSQSTGTSAAEQPQESTQREEPTAIIRMSHIDDVEASRREKTAIAGHRAKIVCVSTQYAGQEYDINKTEMVIGRTEDNDIPIDHRSVSRHHAKIITAGRSVKIVDLKSANGTLVNGEEYAQADLKSGDLIELGHVKFRFVPAGENYTYTTEEHSAIQQGTGAQVLQTIPEAPQVPTGVAGVLRANPLLVIAIAGLAVAIVVMIFWLVSSGERVTATPTTATEVPVAEAPSAADPRAAASSDAERMVSRANLAFSQRQWQQAASLARAAAMIDPNHAGAKELLQKAQVEAEAQAAYERGVTAINESQWSDAWNQLQAVPPTSVYATQTAALRKQVKAKLIIDKVREADAALASEDWAKAESLADELVFLNPAHPDIDRIRRAASEGRKPKVPAAAPKPRIKLRAKTTGKQKPQAGAPAAPAAAPKAAGGEARALYNEAIAALKNNQYPQAIDKLNACIKADKRFCFCYRAMGIAYARVGNGPKAYRFYKQYLKTCPSAKDAADVEKLLRQYEQAQ